MTGLHQTRSSGQVRTSSRRHKVVQKTEKVRRTKLSNTSESRRNLNGRSRGREIAARPYPKVDVARLVDCNSEVEEMDNEEDDHLRQPMRRQIVSSTEGAMKR